MKEILVFLSDSLSWNIFVCPSSFQALSSPKIATLMMNPSPVFSAISLHLIGFSLPEQKLTHLGVTCHSPGPHLQAWCSCLLASEPPSSCFSDPKAVHSFVTLGPQAALCSVVSTSLIRHGEEEGPATVRALCVLNLEGGNESLASPHDPHLKRSILTAGV